AKGFTQRVGNFTQRRASTRGIDGSFENVAFARARYFAQRIQRLFATLRITLTANLFDACNLRIAHGGVVDVENVEIVFAFEAVLVDADNDFIATVDRRLLARCSFLDQTLRQAFIDRFGHAAHRLDFLDQ